jgi:uncharacterized membrane protein YfcA
MDISVIALIAFVVLLIGLSKTAFAGALGVFAVPLLMLKLPAPEAIALMLPLLIIADILSVKSYWKQWDSRLLLSLIPGAIIGVLVAYLTIDVVNANYLKAIVASLCILFALKNILFKQKTFNTLNNKWGALLMPAFSGITSTLVHAGGPPLIIYFSAIKLAPKQFVATAAIFFASMNIFKLIGAISLGLLSNDIIVTALAFIPLALIGNWIGLKVNSRMNKVLFLKLMNYLLLLLGLWLFIK